MSLLLVVLLSAGTPTDLPTNTPFSMEPDPVGRSVEMRMRRCIEAMKKASPTMSQIREALGVAGDADANDKPGNFRGPGFSVAVHGFKPGQTIDVNINVAMDVHIPWRLVKQWATRWKTVHVGEYTTVRATLPAADGGAAVVANAVLFLTPEDMNSPVFSVSFRQN